MLVDGRKHVTHGMSVLFSCLFEKRMRMFDDAGCHSEADFGEDVVVDELAGVSAVDAARLVRSSFDIVEF